MITKRLSQVAWRRFVDHNACPWGELEEFPGLPADQQRRVLAERLLSQIRYFGARQDALPEWREAACIRDCEELWRIWPSLPIINKTLLNSRFHPDELRTRFHLTGIEKSTGGSTGEPTHFFHDTPAVRASNASTLYAYQQMGWRPGMTLISVWGSERDIGKQTSRSVRAMNRVRRVFTVGGYNLNQDTVDTVLRLIRKHHPVAIYGFTSMLDFVARRIVEMGAAPPPGMVHTSWNGGEMLFETQIAAFRKAFGVPILNLYGGRELSAMAYQNKPNGPLIVLRPWLFLEVVDDDGRPAPPGASGRLLWTSTICRGTPFLRYEIGDLGDFDTDHQNESGITALREVQGRTAGLLSFPNGKRVNCIYWNHLFKEMPEVCQFQVIMRQDDTLQILLKGKGFTPEREVELRKTLQAFVGNIGLEITWVDRIPLTPQGKLVQVVNRKCSS